MTATTTSPPNQLYYISWKSDSSKFDLTEEEIGIYDTTLYDLVFQMPLESERQGFRLARVGGGEVTISLGELAGLAGNGVPPPPNPGSQESVEEYKTERGERKDGLDAPLIPSRNTISVMKRLEITCGLMFIFCCLCWSFLVAQPDNKNVEVITELFKDERLSKFLPYQSVKNNFTFVIFQNEELIEKVQLGEFKVNDSLVLMTEPWIFYHDIQYFFVVDEVFYNEDRGHVVFHSTSRYKFSDEIDYVKGRACLKNNENSWVVKSLILDEEKCCDW